ncbi:MAG: GntR family transcriptional regulator [Tissierellaceae bacterium]|nr:GntR family transcriptional regulator [Tissierellaceae bacterium]
MKIKGKTVSLSQIAKKKIKEYIDNEGLQSDDILPSEGLLMEKLGVSRYTVREALALLEQERTVYKVQGKGTFVNRKPINIESGLEKLDSITEIIKSFGYMPGTKWIAVERGEPTEDMVEKFGLKEGEKVVTFKRLRTADGEAAAYLVDTIPEKYLGDRDAEDIKTESLFTFFEKELDIVIEYAITEISPVFPTMEMIKYLEVDKSSLFLLFHQLHHDRDGRLILYSFDYFDPKIFNFKVNRIRIN